VRFSLVVIVHAFYLIAEFVINDPAFDFHGGSQFTGADIKWRFEDSERLDLFVSGKTVVNMIDFLLNK